DARHDDAVRHDQLDLHLAASRRAPELLAVRRRGDRHDGAGPGRVSALHVVVMGVAGCGESEVGQRIAHALMLPLVEGDAFHPAANIAKMRSGTPLDDEDRAGWLDALGRELASRPGGAVLTCSALKRAYREQLRRAVPALAFVHLA